MAVRITQGTGSASIASELIATNQYQIIKVADGTASGTTGLKVNADGSINIAGSVAAAVTAQTGSVVAFQGGAWQVASSVIGHAPVVIVGGSIAASFTPPANQSVSGTVQTDVRGSVATVIIGGSIAASFTPPANQSVSGTTGASVIGWVPIQASNTSVITVGQGSIGAVIIGGSIAATVTPAANQSVSGTVGASVLGWVPIQPSNTSVITVAQANSIAGTYAEDVAHTPADRGLFALGVRNDTLASVTSADGDYSQNAVGPSGETVAVDAPFTRWVSGVADLRVVLGASVTAIPAQGASVFTYVREVQVANFGSNSVLVKIGGGLGSTLGWTIAPAGGGSNFTTRYKTGENSAVTASINGTASVLVTISGFTARI